MVVSMDMFLAEEDSADQAQAANAQDSAGSMPLSRSVLDLSEVPEPEMELAAGWLRPICP